MRYLHTMVRVSDLEKSLDFYCNKLGLVEVSRKENEKGRFTLVFLSAPDDAEAAETGGAPMVELTWNWDEQGYQGGRNFGHLAYRVGDIYALCEKLMQAGVTINRPPRDGHMAFVRSPDGISIELLQDGTLPPRGTLVFDAKQRQLVGDRSENPPMNFASDNAYGALPEILAALAEAGKGAALPYGDDAATAALGPDFHALFERELALFPVLTGTAANALALATLVPPHGAVLCHENSHIMVHECGAPEFFSHGAKLIGLAGADGKLAAETVAATLNRLPRGFVHSVEPLAISLSQPTELGTVYSLDELTAIAAIAHAHGLKLHLDGARFANAVAALGCSPAEASWRCGVDVLSFGASKGGALAAEAVLFFDPAEARDFAWRRKKAGHLVSKMRFVSAQLGAYVEKDLWRRSAARANALASRLGDGLAARGIAILAPVQTNMVFAEIPSSAAERLRAAGAQFYDGLPVGNGRLGARLVTSFATPEADVTKFLALLD